MRISCINDPHQLDELREDWDAAYATDPHATIFVTWIWLRGWIETAPDSWLVLAARPDHDSSYVAFLTLSIDDKRGRLHLGGSSLADYTGFVCLPEYVEEAMTAFAAYTQQQLNWNRFRMRDVFDPRLDLFLQCFSEKKFTVRKTTGISCPYISLPDSWDQYLGNFLGSGTRKRLRRYLRRVDNSDELCVNVAQEDNIERYIDIFLRLFEKRWGKRSRSARHRFRTILRSCFENNYLFLTVLWRATTPIAADLGFIDRQKRVFYGYNGGWDERFAKLSPGSTLTGYAIRYAIENGFRVYDFTRGAESYKFSFGAAERFNTNVIITRKSLRLMAQSLIRRLKAPFKEDLV